MKETIQPEFRAWNKKEKKMFYDFFIDCEGTIFKRQPDYFALTDVEVMQYVGKKDKTGEKIYTKDIIQFKFENTFRLVSVKGVVKRYGYLFTTDIFYNFSFWKEVDKADNSWWVTNLLAQPMNELEIIGNSFENHEWDSLIKETIQK